MSLESCRFDESGKCAYCGGIGWRKVCRANYSNLPDGACLVGTVIKMSFEALGIYSSGSCDCDSYAIKLNRLTCEDAEGMIDEILQEMQQNAKKLKVPFLRSAAKLIVLKSIRDARKMRESAFR